MTGALPLAEPVAWVRPSALVLAEVFDAMRDTRPGVQRRAGAALVGVCAPPLRDRTLALAAALGYDWVAVGGALLDILLSSGRLASPDALAPTVLEVLDFLTPRPDAPAAPVSVPPTAAAARPSPEPEPEDPTPGLTCHGLTYPAWVKATRGERQGNRDAGMMLWREGALALQKGPDALAEWLEASGTARGFAFAPVA